MKKWTKFNLLLAFLGLNLKMNANIEFYVPNNLIYAYVSNSVVSTHATFSFGNLI